jgi:hypothetical protein
LPEVVRADVGQFVMLLVAPQVFDWVELGCVGGQVRQYDLSFQKLDELGYQSTAMSR